jgi:hypothetical protein
MKRFWPICVGIALWLGAAVCWQYSQKLARVASDYDQEARSTDALASSPNRNEPQESIRERADSQRRQAESHRAEGQNWLLGGGILLLAGLGFLVLSRHRSKAERAEAGAPAAPRPSLAEAVWWNVVWLVAGIVCLAGSVFYSMVEWYRIWGALDVNGTELIVALIFAGLGFRWLVLSGRRLRRRALSWPASWLLVPAGALLLLMLTPLTAYVFWSYQESKLWRDLQAEPGNQWKWHAYMQVPPPRRRPEFYREYVTRSPEFLARSPDADRLRRLIEDIDRYQANDAVALAAKQRIQERLQGP